ncbi:hypothetical protein D047_2253B, partial [Vibrio parahaemolyticus VPTS-2010_2]
RCRYSSCCAWHGV